MNTGEKIRTVRQQQGLTQAELATKANVNPRTIQRIESGEVIARSYTLKTIARALGLEEPELLGAELVEGHEEPVKKTKNLRSLLAWLHLSGLLLLPTLLVWLCFRKTKGLINHHAAVAINFQLSMLSVLLPCLLVPGIPPIIALFTLVVVLINAVRIATGKSYYYPFSIPVIATY